MLYIVDFPPFIQLLYMFFVRINTIYIYISQKIQSLWEYLWGTILMTRSGTFVYMRYASAVGLLPWECGMGSSRTAFSIVTSRRSARIVIKNGQVMTAHDV